MPAKLRREATDLCPHSTKAIPYMTWHICWQDRIAKETSRAMAGTQDAFPPPVAPSAAIRSLGGSLPQFPLERYPMGGRHKLNNNSGSVALTLGPSSWKASGDMKSMTRASMGQLKHERQSQDFDAFAAAREEANRLAAANQISAVRQRGTGTLLRIGQTPAEDLEEAARQGHGTMLALADGVQGRGTPGSGPGPSRRRRSTPSDAPLSPAGGELADLAGAARSEAARAAAANQLAAVRQRSQGTLLRLGQTPTEQLEEAHQRGHGTMVALARGMRGGGSPRSHGGRSSTAASGAPSSEQRMRRSASEPFNGTQLGRHESAARMYGAA